jgi:hypothetical protein
LHILFPSHLPPPFSLLPSPFLTPNLAHMTQIKGHLGDMDMYDDLTLDMAAQAATTAAGVGALPTIALASGFQLAAIAVQPAIVVGKGGAGPRLHVVGSEPCQAYLFESASEYGSRMARVDSRTQES